jgi:pyruvate dehydrogenase E2 component (dihydrolipoamide acetyltransferase)
VVKELKVKVGDKVSEGSVVIILDSADAPAARPAPAAAPPPPATPAPAPAPAATPAARPAPVDAAAVAEDSGATPHASPGVRRFARELGVELLKVKGSGPKGRILKEDVQEFVKASLSGAGTAAPRATGAGFADLGLPAWPKVDFAKFGPIDPQPLSRIKKISGPVLARNWVMIPHVTQFDEADITDLEAFRARVNEESAKTGTKVTPLAFLIKACVAALKKFPDFNASIDGDNLVLKRYWHIGFAADTPNGLVVPVIKDADRKGIVEIAKETGELAAKAREGKLGPAEMQGGTFTISSLGGIGGTAFTPIINAPEVAILGVSKASMKPVWNGKEFTPRLMMPLSLSYDHRIIDGAAAARFTTYLAQVIADLRRGML